MDDFPFSIYGYAFTVNPQAITLAAAAVVAILMVFWARKSRRSYLSLPELPLVDDSKDEGELPVAVIIPARNEAHQIARVVGSFPRNPVIVVDDASTDGTAEAAVKAGAFVVKAPQLRSKKQKGKPNACAKGAESTQADWLLFVDADTWYEPSFAASLFAYANEHQISMTTVFLKQECVGIWERMILPYAFGLYFCGVDGRAVNDPMGFEALANGQCMLWKRANYEFAGGHRAVGNSVIEDVELARVAKRHHLSTMVLRGEKLGHVRMYDSLRAIWSGFAKNSFRFLLVNPRTGFQVVMASMTMTAWLPVLAVLCWQKYWLAALAFYFVPPIAWAPWYGGFGRALLAPYAIYFFQTIALNAMVRTTFGLETRWKGRRI